MQASPLRPRPAPPRRTAGPYRPAARQPRRQPLTGLRLLRYPCYPGSRNSKVSPIPPGPFPTEPAATQSAARLRVPCRALMVWPHSGQKREWEREREGRSEERRVGKECRL